MNTKSIERDFNRVLYLQIREALPHGRLSDIAKEYGLTRPRISQIIKGRYRAGTLSETIYRKIIAEAQAHKRQQLEDVSGFKAS